MNLGKALRTRIETGLHWMQPIVAQNPVFDLGAVEEFSSLGGGDVFLVERNRAGMAMRAIFEFHQVMVDCCLLHRMAGTYPWRRSAFSRHEHLKFVWWSYLHQCYLFEEKSKLTYNALNEAAKLRALDPIFVSGVVLKKCTGGLRRFARERGEMVHGWRPLHPALDELGMAEVLAKVGWSQHPQVSPTYSAARAYLRGEMAQGLLIMANGFDLLVSEQRESISKVFQSLAERAAAIRASRN